MNEQNKALVGRHFTELWNLGDLLVADEIYAADYVAHHPLAPEAARGPAGEKDLVVRVRTAVADLYVVVEDVVAEEDRVAVRWTLRGTNTGGLLGFPPTAQEVVLTGIKLVRIAGGRIAEGWDSVDLLDLVRQLGANTPTGDELSGAGQALRGNSHGDAG